MGTLVYNFLEENVADIKKPRGGVSGSGTPSCFDPNRSVGTTHIFLKRLTASAYRQRPPRVSIVSAALKSDRSGKNGEVPREKKSETKQDPKPTGI